MDQMLVEYWERWGWDDRRDPSEEYPSEVDFPASEVSMEAADRIRFQDENDFDAAIAASVDACPFGYACDSGDCEFRHGCRYGG